MITNFETNKIYVAKGLNSQRYADVAYTLLTLLSNLHINCEELPCTQSQLHIWARDYMPVQVSKEKFICFRYEPDYLNNCPKYKPQRNKILENLNIDVCYSSINIDGGNIISCGNKVILTDKILIENPQYTTMRLLDELSALLEAEIILIPWDRYEEYGHADGMVRYLGGNRILLNNYCNFDKCLRNRLLKTLSVHFDIEELNYGAYTKNSWAYINFLHVGKDIFVPMLNEALDSKAFKQIEAAYPMCKCHPINNSMSLVKDGGALNCSTWNILY